MKSFALTLALALLPTSSAYALTETKSFNAEGIKTLKLESLQGHVKISVSKENKAYMVAEKVTFEEDCVLETEVNGSTLVIEVDRKGWFSSDQCRVNFEIQVPRKIALNLATGSGDVDVQGTEGAVDLKLGSGSAKFKAVIERLNTLSGSGNLEASGLVGEANIKTGSGDVTLTYSRAPQAGELDIKTGAGDVTLFLPEQSRVLTRLISGSGSLFNELGDSKDAPFEVSMKSGAGNLKVKKLK